MLKDGLKTFCFTGIPFGIVMGTFTGIMAYDFQIGLVAGIFMGVLFGFVSSVFVMIQSTKFRKNRIKMSGGKEILMDGGANHIKNKESVGGWLVLTEKELIFKSHGFNIQNHELITPLNQIVIAQPSLRRGIIPNGLIITTNTAVEEFVVFNRKEWARKINENIPSHNSDLP